MRKESWRRLGIICSLFMYFLYVVLLILRTKMLIDNYGSEVNAVFQTSNQIFTYMILFESGMSAAYQFKMYSSVSCKDERTTASFFMGLKRSMRKISFRMAVVLLAVSVVYPFIMNRILLAFSEVGLMLFLLGLRVIIPYCVSSASKTLLNVYDYKYIVDNVDSLGYIVITVAEIWTIDRFHCSVYIVLLIGCVGNIVIGFAYTFIVRKLCAEVRKKTIVPNSEPEEMTKDILFHQITGLLNSNIDTIILSIVNILLVTPYHAYYSTMNYFSQIINKINENYRTKISMKIKQGDQNLYSYFQVLLAFHMVMTISSVVIFICNINDFIYLWIGKEFLLSDCCIILLALYLMLKMTINIIFLVRDGAGLYKESKWFSFREGIVNLVLSVILVQFWGIEGILFATVLATYSMLLPGNVRLAYNQVMGKRNTLWVDYLVMIITATCLVWGIGSTIGGTESISWKTLLLRLIIQTCVSGAIAVLVVAVVKWKYIVKYILEKN